MPAAAGSDLVAPPVVLAAAVADAVVQVAAEVVVAADAAVADAVAALEVDAVQVAAADAGPSMDNSLPSATGAGATRRNRPIPARSP